MAKMTFSNSWGKVKAVTKTPEAPGRKTPEELVRDMKNAARAPGGEDYREKSLRIHGLVCARCAREFSGVSRQLLTVHHKDGNHHNNPADGSNWENLCVYCHDDIHSREVLADQINTGSSAPTKEVGLVYAGMDQQAGSGLLAEKLKKALEKKSRS
ncbi:MAG: YajD family HNH nuclease [Smithellaceae bacterium]